MFECNIHSVVNVNDKLRNTKKNDFFSQNPRRYYLRYEQPEHAFLLH